MNKINNIKSSISWTISLIGFPLLSIILLVSFGFVNSIYSSEITYVLTMSAIFLWFLFAIVNMLFSFYTLIVFWSGFSTIERTKYLAICIFANTLGAYLMAKLWLNDGVNIYSVMNKNIYSLFSLFFYFFVSISIMLPVFISTHNF